MKQFFGYIRVSTTKQGEGVSLQEQKDAIIRYAQRNGLEIVRWFEELETAAKRGRPVFNQMLKLLKQGNMSGVIIHKIDRSARNLKDWADLGELIDVGIEVHFANESLDLNSRGGRLSADIQAVVASDYIRNLREETRKGFYGRIKQGLYPLPAPLGYVDKGKGNPKTIDPVKGPLIRKAFELYASGKFTLINLPPEMYRLGLRNKVGGRVSRTGFSVILNNPFYIGLIRLKRTGETFPGTHQPLIPKSLFDQTQALLRGKTHTKVQIHDFLFRRFFRCKRCGYRLIAERQKGHIYYRCHTKGCPTKAVREERIEEAILPELKRLTLGEKEKDYLLTRMEQIREEWRREDEEITTRLQLQLGKLQDRLNRLTDAFVDQLIDQTLFEERKAALLMERKDVEEKLLQARANPESMAKALREFLELVGSASTKYKMGLHEEKRDLVDSMTSNREVNEKNVILTLKEPFSLVANRYQNSLSAPSRMIPRTLDSLLHKLVAWFKQNPPVVPTTLSIVRTDHIKKSQQNKDGKVAG